MEVCTLASGSSGNSLLICCGSTYVLLDAGISARRITSALKALGADPTRLSAVLVTHEHTDHVSGLATLTKQLGVRPEEDITLAVAPRSECGALYQLERGGALRAFPAREASLC